MAFEDDRLDDDGAPTPADEAPQTADEPAVEPSESTVSAEIGDFDADGDLDVRETGDEPTDTAESVQADADPVPNSAPEPADEPSDAGAEPSEPSEDAPETETEPEDPVPSAEVVAPGAPVPQEVQDDGSLEPAVDEEVVEAIETPIDPAPRVDISPDTRNLPQEAVEDLVERAEADLEVGPEDTVDSIEHLPPSEQAEAAGKTGGESDAETRQRLGASEENEQAVLNQRPVEDTPDTHLPSVNVGPRDDGTTVDPGSYHKPGAALTEEQLESHNPAPQPTLHPKLDVEVGDFDGDGDPDVREVND